MVKKLAVLLSLLLVPMVFATSMINYTGAKDTSKGINANTEVVIPINCICNFSGICSYIENYLCRMGVCYRAGMNYNGINDTVTCPYHYNRRHYGYGCGMHHYRKIYRGAHRMGH